MSNIEPFIGPLPDNLIEYWANQTLTPDQWISVGIQNTLINMAQEIKQSRQGRGNYNPDPLKDDGL